MAHLRPVEDADWPLILSVADVSVPRDPEQNREWLQNRRGFDEGTWRRRHYVVEEGEAFAGYGAVEEGPEKDTFRLFVVLPDEKLTTGTAKKLFDRLWDDLKSLGATKAWTREDMKQLPVYRFLTEHHFEAVHRYRANEIDMVVMERPVE